LNKQAIELDEQHSMKKKVIRSNADQEAHLQLFAKVNKQKQRLVPETLPFYPGYSSSGVITESTSWAWENLGFHVQFHWSYK